MSAPEYDLIVNRWSLGRLYVWMLARHADQFNEQVQQAVRKFRQSISKN